MYKCASVSDLNMNSDDTGVLSSQAQALRDSSSENVNVTEVLCTIGVGSVMAVAAMVLHVFGQKSLIPRPWEAWG